MRKGSKKTTNKVVDTSQEKVVVKREKKVSPPTGAELEKELRTRASKYGAQRAQLVIKQKCGNISASERLTLLNAHLEFGAVKTEQGHEMYASEIFDDAYRLGRDLLRSGENAEHLLALFERVPRHMRSQLLASPPALPAEQPQDIVVTPLLANSEPQVKTRRLPEASVAETTAKLAAVKKPRRSLYNRSVGRT